MPELAFLTPAILCTLAIHEFAHGLWPADLAMPHMAYCFPFYALFQHGFCRKTDFPSAEQVLSFPGPSLHSLGEGLLHFATCFAVYRKAD